MNRISDIWGEPRPYFESWPERADERVLDNPEQWVQSACVLCSNGCGLDIGVKEGRIVGVRGRATDVTNRGRLGPKGLYGWEANSAPDRLKTPLIRKNGRLMEASWDEAMSLIVEKTRAVQKEFTSGALGFYTSGQLFLEEYYTLAVLAKAGLGTPHLDGSTRLCTATADAALKETFGADGQAGSYFDFDVTDCFLLVGHNMSATDTVLWTRVLDRRRGPNPPKLIVIDPRETPTAKEADLHLAPALGTNVALLNGLLHQLIENCDIDQTFIAAHTLGFEELKKAVAPWTPDAVRAATGVPAEMLLRAARLLGNAKTLVSTCLQGVYQSHQATAAAVQVNNINLIRGMIGRPGAGVFQMNGQPTAQNTRETGADGDFSGFRNWENKNHVAELAALWNVDVAKIPAWAPSTHAMQIFRYCETGSIRFLWVSATNPAVSLPHLDRIRAALSREDLFLVVQDCFLTETGAMADVVLPAAMWGEKTGCFTNADRTVHISHKAVEPPGEARSDLEIFLDYARRMEMRDRDGAPLIKWSTPEEAFEAWKECTRGRPCDYTGLSYEKLSQGTGICWPCNDKFPEGNPRPYADLHFPTDPDYCETFGHDLLTGAPIGEKDYRALQPQGRAFLKAARYVPPPELPDPDYPIFLTTGRLVHHFHTRTKTGRAPELQAQAPDVVLDIAAADAQRYGFKDGDKVRITSRRGMAEASVRLAQLSAGTAFLPFHYGYWDNPGRRRAANELTQTRWDPVSKQPQYKYAAVRLEKIEAFSTAQPEDSMSETTPVKEKSAPSKHTGEYEAILRSALKNLGAAYAELRGRHASEADVVDMCTTFGAWADEALMHLTPKNVTPQADLKSAPILGLHLPGGFGLVRDFHALFLAIQDCIISATICLQAAKSMRDAAREDSLTLIQERLEVQQKLLTARIKQAAPQALTVPE